MQSKKDQLQAHNFIVGRLKSALLRGDADAPETPTRRFSAAGFAGVLIAALLVAGCGIYGLVFPGGSRTWRQPGTIIVEKETGTRYIYIDGALTPVLNLASARLLVGERARIQTVSTKSLRGVPHELPIGIPGAPDTLPEPRLLTGASWLVCATTSAGISGEPQPSITVHIGDTVAVSPLPASSAAVVVAPDRTTYLAWSNKRLRAVDRTALVALGFSRAHPHPVAAGWMNALPQGPDLRPPAISRRGESGPAVGGRSTRIGQVLAVDIAAAGRDYYAVLEDGLTAMSPTTAFLMLADPESQSAYDGGPVRPIIVGADTVVSAPRSSVASLDPPDLPAAVPEPLDLEPASRQALCGRHSLGVDASVELVLAEVGATSAAAGGGRLTADPRVADAIVVEPGRGILAAAQPTTGVRGQTLYLVTDVGIKYPLASKDAVTRLGYGSVAPVDVPASLLAFLPTGPALDPAYAGSTYAGQPITYG